MVCAGVKGCSMKQYNALQLWQCVAALSTLVCAVPLSVAAGSRWQQESGVADVIGSNINNAAERGQFLFVPGPETPLISHRALKVCSRAACIPSSSLDATHYAWRDTADHEGQTLPHYTRVCCALPSTPRSRVYASRTGPALRCKWTLAMPHLRMQHLCLRG